MNEKNNRLYSLPQKRERFFPLVELYFLLVELFFLLQDNFSQLLDYCHVKAIIAPLPPIFAS